MRFSKPLLFAVCLAVLCSGCATHLDYYAYGPTRKFLDSGVPGFTKGVCIPFVFLPDTIACPFGSYRDTVEHAPESKGGHVYLSYVGFRTLLQSDLKPVYKWVGGSMCLIVDTLWFPAAAIADTIYSVQN